MKTDFYKSFILFQIALLGAFSASNAQNTGGQNPILRNFFTADPAAMVYNDRVYLYVGRDQAADGEMFTMHEWLCYSSTDVKNWTYHGPIMKAVDFKWAKGDAWAAQVIEKGGKFYFYTTVTGNNPYGGRNVGVAVSDSPTGPFVDARGTPLVRDNMTNNGKAWDDIDPTVFIDDDGQAYLSWGNPICYIAKLKPNMIELDGAISIITPPNYGEAPWLHKRGNLYYLTYAAFVAPLNAEQICYATATSINGPWTYRGILTGTARNSYTIHPAIIEFKGQPYFFYHNAILTLNGQGPALGRRSVCVEYLCYNADGTIKPITQTTTGVSGALPCQATQPSVTQTPFKGSPHAIPGRIQAEDYDNGGQGVAFHEANANGNQGGATYRNDQVDIETTADVGGGYNIAYILNGEWLEYTVNVTQAGAYSLDLRLASDGAGKTLHVEVDGVNLTGAISVPSTGGWQAWQTVTVNNLNLTAGQKVLRIAFDSDYMNLNWVEFKKQVTTGLDEERIGFASISPNPFTHEGLRIDHAADFHYQIMDMSGVLMEQGQAVKGHWVGQNLPSGVYLLTIVAGNNTSNHKIVKQ